MNRFEESLRMKMRFVDEKTEKNDVGRLRGTREKKSSIQWKLCCMGRRKLKRESMGGE